MGTLEHDCVKLVTFSWDTLYICVWKKKSQCFVVSGISEHTDPNNKGYKKYPNKLIQGHSQLLGDFGEKSQGPNKKVFAGICVFVCVCYYIQIPLYKVIK